MKPTTSRKTILLGLAALAVLASFFFVSLKRGAKTVSLKNASGVVLPLIIKADLSALTPEQKKEIADFRALIISRIKSRTPLTKEEKITVSLSLTTTKKEAPSGTILVDQNIYQFSDDELRAIRKTLNK